MVIKDSGARRQFATGAVRDIQEGKGRCDLLPLDVVSGIYSHNTDNYSASKVLMSINDFVKSGNVTYLMNTVNHFLLGSLPFGDDSLSTLCLEVSKHFEEGCKKYGENNWRKGIPAHCYVDSAVRHYLKYIRGDKDEPHDRAFVWNLICCIWTCNNKPELNDYAKGGDKDESQTAVETK